MASLINFTKFLRALSSQGLKTRSPTIASQRVNNKLAKQEARNPEITNENSAATRSFSKINSRLPFSLGHHKSATIGAVFLVVGTTTLILSIYLSSQIMALVGLGLTFWGALFNLTTPVRYVEGNLLNSTAISTYITIDRIIDDCKYKGKAYYLPPYSREEYLPGRLKGLKETVAFISANNDVVMPSLEDIAQSKFALTNKKGILIAPPGLGLLTKIEKKMPPTTKIGISDIFESVPKIVSENLGLAREITMSLEMNSVKLMIRDSLYFDLHNPGSNLKSISLLGCPITSAIACVIARHIGRPVTIQNIKVTPENLTTEIEYQILQE